MRKIEWSAQRAWCPQGCQSVLWMARQDRNGHEVIHIKFAAKDCSGCLVRSQCTHALKEPRSIMIRAESTYQVLQHARQRQQTPAFKDLYAKRAGIEGTLSEASTGLWTPTIPLCGRSENTLTNVHDRRRHQCRSHWGLDRGTARWANSSLPFCCLSTNWLMDALSQPSEFANRILTKGFTIKFFMYFYLIFCSSF
jgi:Transposase DDE domain